MFGWRGQMMKSKNTLSHSLKNGVYITTPGVTVLAAKPTCCHQDTALGIYNPLTQGVRGEPCKLRHETDKNTAAVRGSCRGSEKLKKKYQASCVQKFLWIQRFFNIVRENCNTIKLICLIYSMKILVYPNCCERKKKL